MPLVTSKTKKQFDEKFMAKRAGKKEEPKLSKDELKKLYKENESNNYHTENALMLAKNFGTKREQNAIAKALDYRNKAGGYRSDDPMANLHYKTTHEIHSKYWPHLHDEEE
jgi:predicted negative regulator of RcsB-dependent stress response